MLNQLHTHLLVIAMLAIVTTNEATADDGLACHPSSFYGTPSLPSGGAIYGWGLGGPVGGIFPQGGDYCTQARTDNPGELPGCDSAWQGPCQKSFTYSAPDGWQICTFSYSDHGSGNWHDKVTWVPGTTKHFLTFDYGSVVMAPWDGGGSVSIDLQAVNLISLQKVWTSANPLLPVPEPVGADGKPAIHPVTNADWLMFGCNNNAMGGPGVNAGATGTSTMCADGVLMCQDYGNGPNGLSNINGPYPCGVCASSEAP